MEDQQARKGGISHEPRRNTSCGGVGLGGGPVVDRRGITWVAKRCHSMDVGAGGARRALERCRRDRVREHECNEHLVDSRTRVGLGHKFLLQLSQLFPRLGSSFIHGSPPPRTPTPTDSTMQGDSRWACAVRGHGGERELGGHGADWAQLQSPGFYAITTVKRDYNV